MTGWHRVPIAAYSTGLSSVQSFPKRRHGKNEQLVMFKTESRHSPLLTFTPT